MQNCHETTHNIFHVCVIHVCLVTLRVTKARLLLSPIAYIDTIYLKRRELSDKADYHRQCYIAASARGTKQSAQASTWHDHLPKFHRFFLSLHFLISIFHQSTFLSLCTSLVTLLILNLNTVRLLVILI